MKARAVDKPTVHKGVPSNKAYREEGLKLFREAVRLDSINEKNAAQFFYMDCVSNMSQITSRHNENNLDLADQKDLRTSADKRIIAICNYAMRLFDQAQEMQDRAETGDVSTQINLVKHY